MTIFVQIIPSINQYNLFSFLTIIANKIKSRISKVKQRNSSFLRVTSNQSTLLIHSSEINEQLDFMNKIMNNLEKVTKAQQYKEQGNEAFKVKDYKKALSNYHKVFLYVNGLMDQKNDLVQYQKDKQDILSQQAYNQVLELKYATHLNMAQVYINQNNFEKGKKSAQSSLEIKESAKGYFRLGICQLQLNELDEAQQSFIQAQQSDKKIEIGNYLQEIQIKSKKADQGLAQAMKKMWV